MTNNNGTAAESEPLVSTSGNTAMLQGTWGQGEFVIVQDDGILTSIAPYWWVFILRGVLMIAFGIFCLFYPGITLIFLTTIFGYLMILDGMACLLKMTSQIKNMQRGLVEGSRRAGIAACALYGLNAACNFTIGIYAFMYTGITAYILLMFIAAWFVTTGVLEISSSIAMRRELGGGSEWGLGLGGLLFIFFGIMFIINPVAGVLVFTNLIGMLAMIFGIQVMFAGIKLRNLNVCLRHRNGDTQNSPPNLTVDVV